MICNLFPEPTFFFFSSEVPALLYYAQIPGTFIALLFSFFIFWNGRKILLNKLLFIITFFFLCWTMATLVAWTNIHSSLILFVWSFLGLILGLISVSSIYFIYVFLEKGDVSLRIKTIFLTLLSPTIILTPTYFNLSGFNITNCDAFDFEWFPFKTYSSLLGVLAMVWISGLLIHGYKIAKTEFRKQIVLMGVGIELFLFSFFGMEFLGTYLTKIGVLKDSQLELYGMFGMVIFMIYIGILVVRFKAFNIKLLATQAIVLSESALIFSLLFSSGMLRSTRIIVFLTFLLVSIVGYLLIRSVKREILQKEKLQHLTESLEDANVKLQALDKLKSEFISLASHQLRSPLTVIKGYASTLTDGIAGDLTPKQDEIVRHIYTSASGLASVVEDFLNVTKVEQGGMKYVFAPTDIRTIVNDLVSDMRIPAELKHLDFQTDVNEGVYMCNADATKMKQVFLNLIDNSIKYTQQGFVKVWLHKAVDEHGKDVMKFGVSDSGVGVSAETKAKLFQKFSRGEGASMNGGGSGLGLYLAQEIVKAHGGEIKIDSEGLGHGSTFSVMLPLLR